MKQIIIIMLCLVWWSSTVSAQCYTQLIDASGITLESTDIKALQDSACALRKVFPEALRDSFSVIDLGFYALTDDTEGGIAEFTRIAEKSLRENPSTKYYLLFGRQSDNKNGPNAKVFIKVKLPTWGNFKCMTEMDKSLFQIRLELESEKTAIVMPDTYVRIERDVMSKMRAMVFDIMDCCYAARGCTKNCGSEREFSSFLAKKGFVAYECKILTSFSNSPTTQNNILDYAKIDLSFRGQTLKAYEHLQAEMTQLKNLNLKTTGFITLNENFCDNKLTSVIAAFELDDTDYDIHWHLWKNPNPNGSDILFERMTDYKAFMEKTVLSKLNDRQSATKGCHATLRVGNSGSTRVGKTVESWIVQLDYLMFHANAAGEYAIPKAGKNGGYGYVDLVDLTTLEIFEVKHGTEDEIKKGIEQVNKYVALANIECPRLAPLLGTWILGTNYVPRVLPNPRDPKKVLTTELRQPGLIVYRESGTTTQPSPVVVPKRTWERIRKFMERLGHNPSDIDLECAKFLRENPDIAVAFKSAATTIGISIAVATVVEDILTLGAGIADDWACFMVSYRLIKIAAL